MTADQLPGRRPGSTRDLVVVVASAGGVEALKQLVRGLPADLPATVLVGLHLPPAARSYLPEILRRAGRLDVVQAADDLPLQRGQVVTARPDAHLVVVDGRIALGHGARENGAKPAHDVMLRAAALSHGRRVLGVVLTGLLDDGAAGLAAVARHGGACLVQDPDDAEFPSMPRAALEAVPTARCVRLDTLAEEVVRAVTEPLPELNDVPDDRVVRFRCRTGHAWTAESLVAQQDDAVEAALWTALRVLEERAEMSRRLAECAAHGQRAWTREHFTRRAEDAMRSAELLRAVLHCESALPAMPKAAGEP